MRRSQRQRQTTSRAKEAGTPPATSSVSGGGRKRQRRISEDSQLSDVFTEAQTGPSPSAGPAETDTADRGFDAAPTGVVPPSTIPILTKDPLHSDPNGLHLRHMKVTVDQTSQQPADLLPAAAASRPVSPETGSPDMVDAMEDDIDESASAEESLPSSSPDSMARSTTP